MNKLSQYQERLLIRSFVLLHLLHQIVLEFTDVAGLDLKGLLHSSYLFNCAAHVLDLFDPLIDVHLILLDLSLNDCYIIDDFLGFMRHAVDFFHQLGLLRHVSFLKLEH